MAKKKDYKDYLNNIYELTLKGQNDREICDILDISHNLFYQWKKLYDDINDTIKRAKKERSKKRVELAEDALLRKVTGYSYIETKTKSERIDGKLTPVEETKTTKNIVPSDTAIIFTLCNELPEKYKRTDQEIKENNKDKDKNLVILPSKTTIEDWEKQNKDKT
jgi:hypothetical protein